MPRKRVAAPAPSEVYELKVTLRGSRPPIWRRLRVLGSTSLHSLHRILQDAMGWTNSHLYQFTLDERQFSERHPDDDIFDVPPEDARRVALRRFHLNKGDRFTYVYDFGDHWEHEVRVEAVFAPVWGEAYPRCIGGARACPPEDSGGTHGYAELLEALADPHHPQHAEYSQWVPEGFDPEAFNPVETDRLLQRLHGRPVRSKRSTPRPNA